MPIPRNAGATAIFASSKRHRVLSLIRQNHNLFARPCQKNKSASVDDCAFRIAEHHEVVRFCEIEFIKPFQIKISKKPWRVPGLKAYYFIIIFGRVASYKFYAFDTA